MTKTRMGMLAGIAGAAFATWWYTTRTTAASLNHGHERGETIFRNTPQPTENDALGG